MSDTEEKEWSRNGDDGEQPSSPAVAAISNKGSTQQLSVQRLSQNNTWQRMKMRRKSSFGDDADISPSATDSSGNIGAQNMESKRRRRSWRPPSIKQDQAQGHNSEEVYIVDDESTIVEAILSPDRINALLACDINTLSYDPKKWNLVLSLRGRNLPMIAVPLLLLTLWGIFWIVLLSYDQFASVRDSIAELEGLIGPLLVPVSFLLVFRLGRAAVRYWDARKAVGRVVEMCRVFSSTAASSFVGAVHNSTGEKASDERMLDDIARWTCVFPIAVKNFLQPSSRKGWDTDALLKKRRFEIGSLLTNDEADAVLNTSDVNTGPILVLNKLRKLIWQMSAGPSSRQSGPRDMLYQQLNQHIDNLTGAWGACERINGTPLPFVYVVHLRTFLLLYLLLWQMEAAANHGWVALPTVLCASWGLLGIEAAAVECERPFQWHGNHLPLGKMCVVASRNVAQTLMNLRASFNQ